MDLPDNPKQLEEAELESLFDRSRQRDLGAFEQLIKQYEGAVVALLWSKGYASEDIKDIMQETLIKVWKNIDQAQSAKKFLSWFAQIAVNKGNDFYQKEKRKRQIAKMFSIKFPLNFFLRRQSEASQNEERGRMIKTLLFELPEEEREVVSLYYYSKNTYQEIADSLEIYISTVRTRLKNARDKLSLKFKDVFFGGLAVNLAYSSPLPNVIEKICSGQALPLPAEFATTTATIASASVITSLNQYLLFFLSFPFLAGMWLLSILTGILSCGASLVENAKSTQLRRWHTWNNFILYNLIFVWVIPLIAFMSVFPHQWKGTIVTAAIALFGVGIYLRIAMLLRTTRTTGSILVTAVPQSNVLNDFIQYGFIISTIANVVSITWIVISSFTRESISAENWCFMILAGLVLGLFHYHAFRQFQCFLDLCQNDILSDASVTEKRNYSIAFYFYIISIILAIGPGIIHLITKNTQTILATIEIVLFAGLWIVLYFGKIKTSASSTSKKQATALMLFFQILVMIFVRQLIC